MVVCKEHGIASWFVHREVWDNFWEGEGPRNLETGTTAGMLGRLLERGMGLTSKARLRAPMLQVSNDPTSSGLERPNCDRLARRRVEDGPRRRRA